MTVQRAIDNRETAEAIVVQFLYRYGWIEVVLYDTRKTPYDPPYPLSAQNVESIVKADSELTMIIIDSEV